MDLLNKKVYRETMAKMVEKYDISEENFEKLLKLYSDYMFFNVNKMEITGDLKYKKNRFLFPGIGIIYMPVPILIENEVLHDRISEKDYTFTKKWFSGQYYRHRRKLWLYGLKNKFTNPWLKNEQ